MLTINKKSKGLERGSELGERRNLAIYKIALIVFGFSGNGIPVLAVKAEHLSAKAIQKYTPPDIIRRTASIRKFKLNYKGLRVLLARE
jgi:hypothetical protein